MTSTGAATGGGLWNKAFFKNLQNSQESAPARFSFLNKVVSLKSATLWKKETLLAQVFSCEFFEIFKNNFSQNKSVRLLLPQNYIEAKFLRSLSGYKEIYETLREMCPNTEFFLIRIFPHSDWIRRDTSYLSIFSPNAGKYGPEKIPYLDTFTQCESKRFCCFLPNYNNRFLTIDIDLNMKYKQDIRSHHQTCNLMATLIRNCDSFFALLFKFLQRS